MPLIIRQAVEADLPTLYHFEEEIVAAERPFDDSLKAGQIHYYDILALIQSPFAEVIVAEQSGTVIASGFAEIRDGEGYQDFERYAYLGFMYVMPEYRGQGINQLIIQRLINWAKNKGISEMRLEVYDDNIRAKKAYLKSGFKPNLLKMRMKV